MNTNEAFFRKKWIEMDRILGEINELYAEMPPELREKYAPVYESILETLGNARDITKGMEVAVASLDYLLQAKKVK